MIQHTVLHKGYAVKSRLVDGYLSHLQQRVTLEHFRSAFKRFSLVFIVATVTLVSISRKDSSLHSDLWTLKFSSYLISCQSADCSLSLSLAARKRILHHFQGIFSQLAANYQPFTNRQASFTNCTLKRFPQPQLVNSAALHLKSRLRREESHAGGSDGVAALRRMGRSCSFDNHHCTSSIMRNEMP